MVLASACPTLIGPTQRSTTAKAWFHSTPDLCQVSHGICQAKTRFSPPHWLLGVGEICSKQHICSQGLWLHRTEHAEVRQQLQFGSGLQLLSPGYGTWQARRARATLFACFLASETPSSLSKVQDRFCLKFYLQRKNSDIFTPVPSSNIPLNPTVFPHVRKNQLEHAELLTWDFSPQLSVKIMP